MSDLEKKFEEVQALALKEIREQLNIASEALSKAEQISEEHGIPFYSHVSPLSQGFKPNSFYEKWGELENVDDYLEFSPECEGWQHSAVCY